MTFHQTADGVYPDVLAIVSGYFEPKDRTRCLVCGAMRTTVESTCGRRCFSRMCAIQRSYTEADVNRWIEAAEKKGGRP